MVRKIDRFFDDDILTKDVSVFIKFFVDSDKYQEYCDGLEHYLIAIPRHINEDSPDCTFIPLPEETAFKNLNFTSYLLHEYIHLIYENCTDNIYRIFDFIDKKFHELAKDTLEELFKKGLITFEIIKRDGVKIKNIGYYSKFFDKTIVE